MKSIYRSIDDSMHEQMEEKVAKHIENGFGENYQGNTFFDGEGFDKAMKAYSDSLRIIPCSRPHSWEDGKEYEEGKDYKIDNIIGTFKFDHENQLECSLCSPLAIPSTIK